MNARKSENYLAISRSSSASKSVEIFWAKIYRGQLFIRAESNFDRKLWTVFVSATEHGSSAGCKFSKVNFRVETIILVSMSEEIIIL
jgi:hypothetical protein